MGHHFLIACDLDGTLLTEKRQISSRTKHVLQYLQNKGHKVVIATGRPFHKTRFYYEELNLKTPVVNLNGGWVHHPVDFTFPRQVQLIPLEIAQAILQQASLYDLKNVQADVLEETYIERSDDPDVFYFNVEPSPDIRFGPVLHSLKSSPSCILLFLHDEFQVHHLAEHLLKLFGDMIKIYPWLKPFYVIEILPKHLSKAFGLEHIATHLKMKPKQIIAFGDQVNDIEMLQFAGQGIAMGNSVDSVKKAADQITLSNDEDGVAIYLEEFFQLK
jgi:Cof subfamily protein (haloacid dehalogenase superfamily)